MDFAYTPEQEALRRRAGQRRRRAWLLALAGAAAAFVTIEWAPWPWGEGAALAAPMHSYSVYRVASHFSPANEAVNRWFTASSL